MALTRQKKEQVIENIEKLLADSKLTVIAKYQGTSVVAMQQLRQGASAEGTKIQVVKNRLFKRALAANDKLKNIDTAEFVGQLLYAFNSQDEVALARSLADFARTNPQLEFVAAITADGQLLAASTVKVLASLPTKDVLRAQLVGAIGAPLSGFVHVLSGNVRGVLNVLKARAEMLGQYS